MTPQEIAAARRMRKAGISDAAIAAGMQPPVTRQHVHAMLGPRARKPAQTPPVSTPIETESFAAALKAWRTRHGLTQRSAAALLRVNYQSVSFWETKRQGCALASSIMLLMKLLTKDLES
jgi:DNA-binding transcriptional regulator YiaG